MPKDHVLGKSITKVSSIDPKLVAKLKTEGIKSVTDLAAADPKNLSRKLRITEQLASGLVKVAVDHLPRYPELIVKVANELLISHKDLPGFSSASIRGIHPIYDLDGQNVRYYEVKFSSPTKRNNGYAIISASEKDLPVVEFSHQGITHHERFTNRISGKQFKVVRFGPTYFTAEDPNTGEFLDAIGTPPFQLPEELKVHVRSEISDHRASTRPTLELPLRISKIKYQISKIKTTRRAYPILKSTYTSHLTVAPSELRRQWEIAKSPHSPCTYEYHWVDGFTPGQESHTYFTQLPPRTPPNNDPWYSG